MNDTINDKINDLPYYVEGLEGSLREYQQEITKLNEKYNKLQFNWNSLREWIKENSWYYNTSDGCQWVDQFKLLDKMNELEGKDNK